MKVFILGGDGYLGWPQAMYLSAKGHEVKIYDSGIRRQIDEELGLNSLISIPGLPERTHAWKNVTGKNIEYIYGDTCAYDSLSFCIEDFRPDAIIHFAELRSAPYSMLNHDKARQTMIKNVIGTLNVLYAMKEHVPDCHLIKLGSAGEYGQPDIDIEEGFIEINHKGRTDTLPFPKQGGSWYHLTKIHDSHNIMFACKTWGLRSTDLNQGVVYGYETNETALDPGLATRFDYDHIYGTALNRFCCQAAIGHPLTVYGSGNQIRGYINIQDSIRCVELALNNPPKEGEYRVFNQFTEQFSVKDLAAKLAKLLNDCGSAVEIKSLPNPRVEKEEHYYKMVNTNLLNLGLKPTKLTPELLSDMVMLATGRKDRINTDLINPTVDWRKTENKL
jgi:UDP-sulfoquinovose synthase